MAYKGTCDRDIPSWPLKYKELLQRQVSVANLFTEAQPVDDNNDKDVGEYNG